MNIVTNHRTCNQKHWSMPITGKYHIHCASKGKTIHRLFRVQTDPSSSTYIYIYIGFVFLFCRHSPPFQLPSILHNSVTLKRMTFHSTPHTFNRRIKIIYKKKSIMRMMRLRWMNRQTNHTKQLVDSWPLTMDAHLLIQARSHLHVRLWTQKIHIHYACIFFRIEGVILIPR